MIISLETTGVVSMWFLRRNDKLEHEKKIAAKEAQIESIKKDALEVTTTANTKIKMLNELIKSYPDDVALKIFAATGGDKRIRK